MEMGDRLIELIRKGKKEFTKSDETYIETFLADYLLKNGVIVPPCKVGDIVYVITTKRPCYACVLCSDFCHKNCSFDDKNKLVIKIARACDIESNGKINRVLLEIDKSKICHSYEYTCWFQDFGKTVFLTKEEAEKALKEREGNGNERN